MLGVVIMKKFNIEKIKFMKNELVSLLLAGGLAFTLVGCSSSKVNPKDDITPDQVAAVVENQSEEEVLENSLDSVSSSESIIERNLEESDSAVEAAIGIMLEGGEKLVSDSKAATQTESYKEAKEEALDNFVALSEFLRGEREIAGYSIDEVKSDTVEYAVEARDALDEDLEIIYPNYKERLNEKGKELLEWAEEKGTDLAAKGYDKYQELKEKTLEKSKKK